MIVRGVPAVLLFLTWICGVGCAGGLLWGLFAALMRPCVRGKCPPCDRVGLSALAFAVGCFTLMALALGGAVAWNAWG